MEISWVKSGVEKSDVFVCPSEKTTGSSQNFADSKPQLTAMPLRLADPVIAEIRSNRRIEVMALVLWLIKKLNSSITEKAILRLIYTLT